MNKEMLRKVLEKIEENPESWDQGNWASQSGPCGTSLCVAGWACYLTGYRPNFGANNLPPITGTAVNEEGHEVTISEHAREVLGLTLHEANDLFFSMKTQAMRLLKRWSE